MVQFVRRDAERHSNIFVVNATTPAQLFHVLRRQMNRPFDKPLILFTPKHLLHHRPATSALEDFTTGTYFNRVIDDSKVPFLGLAPYPKQYYKLPACVFGYLEKCLSDYFQSQKTKLM